MESRDAVVQLTWVGVVPAVCEHARTQERSGAERSAVRVRWKGGIQAPRGGEECVCVRR